jgi:signal transduction histidine kinase
LLLPIAEENLPFIFDAFKQGDSSTTRAHGGAGLGLYIARKFSELIGATLDVKSELGKGSTFKLTAPDR